MRNAMLSDVMATARAEGRKRITRRLNTPLRAGDVVYHGEALIPYRLKLDGVRVVHYRRDKAMVRHDDGTGVEWSWQVNVIAARYCPERCGRLFSMIRSVSAQRLHELTPDDVFAEGLWPSPSGDWVIFLPNEDTRYFGDPRDAFACLWDTLHNRPGDRWSDNPLVYVVDLGENLSRVEALRLAAIGDGEERLAEGKRVA
jgi:hypothetical protein